jgi:phosphoribosylformimino-5-aminoimidazole carboxamide ribotide isomerase
MITIIPAVDILDGKCVRLEQGDYRLKKVYDEDPVAAARRFEDHGITRLHVVDLDGARDKHIVNWNSLERIVSKTKLIVDFGGGIKTDQDLKVVFESGAAMATIGSVAVTDTDLFQSWLFAYGPEKIILGADAREGKIAVTGWTNVTEISLFDFLREYKAMGIKQVLCTDIARDGMLKGSSVDLYKELIQKFSTLRLIASGGISSIEEIHKLDESGVSGAVIGKALYEGKIGLDEITKFINSR